MITFERHSDPEPLLVQMAGEAYARHLGYDEVPDITWSAENHLDRATSLVIPISMRIGRLHEIPLYFKSFHPTGLSEKAASLWREAFVAGIERDRRLSARFEELSGTNDIGMRRVLAADPQRLMLITLGVDGRPLGKAWKYLLGGSRRELAEHLFTTTGRAIALLEQASEGEMVPDTFLDDHALEVAIRRSRLFFPTSEATKLEASLESLYTQFVNSPGQHSYYAHGDIDHANVFVKGRSINLIDCAWAARPQTFDLSRFLLRLELEIPRLDPWTRALSARVIDGYGRPEVRRAPEFALLGAIKLLALMQRFSSARQIRRYRSARSMLRRTVGRL